MLFHPLLVRTPELRKEEVVLQGPHQQRFLQCCLIQRKWVFSNQQSSSVQLLSHVWLFASPWTSARQDSLPITNSWSLLKFMSIQPSVLESVMPSSHLIPYHPFLLLPSIFPSIRVFSNKSVLRIRWPKYWSFSFSISPSNEYSGLFSFRIDWLDLLQSKELSRVFSNTTVWKHEFFCAQLSLWSSSHIHT